MRISPSCHTCTRWYAKRRSTIRVGVDLSPRRKSIEVWCLHQAISVAAGDRALVLVGAKEEQVSGRSHLSIDLKLQFVHQDPPSLRLISNKLLESGRSTSRCDGARL